MKKGTQQGMHRAVKMGRKTEKKRGKGMKQRKQKGTAKRKTYYFAYGSNLHLGQMARRCPRSKVYRRVILKGWQLTFRGVADIEKCKAGEVRGGLFEITPDCERALDRYEGFPRMYRKEYIQMDLGDGEIVRVMFYKMNADDYIDIPSHSYYNVIKQGYKDFGFAIKHLRDAAIAVFKEVHPELSLKDYEPVSV